MVDGVTLLPRVVHEADRHGFSLHAVAVAVLEPEKVWPGNNGHSTVYLRDAVAAICDDQTGEVVALADRAHALKVRSQPRRGSVAKAKGGGAGSRFPSTVTDLLARARRAGLELIDDRDHYIVRRPGLARQVVIPRTPSDHHSVPNSVLEIRRTLGVDLRTPIRP